MKVCKRCGEDKDNFEFSPDKRNKDGLQSQCKQCYAVERPSKYQKQKKSILKQQSERRRLRKLQAIEYKGSLCVDCGKQYHPSVYEFHHLNPKEKDISPSHLKSHSWEKFKSELDKCVLLCANCHRIRHWNKNEDK